MTGGQLAVPSSGSCGSELTSRTPRSSRRPRRSLGHADTDLVGGETSAAGTATSAHWRPSLVSPRTGRTVGKSNGRDTTRTVDVRDLVSSKTWVAVGALRARVYEEWIRFRSGGPYPVDEVLRMMIECSRSRSSRPAAPARSTAADPRVSPAHREGSCADYDAGFFTIPVGPARAP